MSIFTSGRGFGFIKKKLNWFPFQIKEHKEKNGCDKKRRWKNEKTRKEMCSKNKKKLKTKNRKTMNERKNNKEETLRLT